ncbi:hypothetical protein FRC08_008035 [Ceratobasidium sp. 394]|nr:hypothetical protein FRC08_008035 [Ceratobasidium sp. 394]
MFTTVPNDTYLRSNMFNSVELVLMFLSMFASIGPENVAVVGFLFGLALQYVSLVDAHTSMG